MAKDIKVPFPDGTIMNLSQEDWDLFVNGIENPRKPNKKLTELMARTPPWKVCSDKNG